MNPLSISQIADLAGAKLEQGDGKALVERISTDSRTIKKGELFVALRGENFDGHKFAEDVAKSGAAGAIVDLKWNGKAPKTFAIIRAEDTLLAYQNLAANYRKSLPIKVLGSPEATAKRARKISPPRSSVESFESRRRRAISTTTSDCRARFWTLRPSTKSAFGNLE